jgi:hypothetical protein
MKTRLYLLEYIEKPEECPGLRDRPERTEELEIKIQREDVFSPGNG